MMMKKLIYMAVLLFAVIAVKAQDYEAFNKFMRDYSKGWMTDYRKPAGNTMEMIKQVGEPAPEFYFPFPVYKRRHFHCISIHRQSR